MIVNIKTTEYELMLATHEGFIFILLNGNGLCSPRPKDDLLFLLKSWFTKTDWGT